VSDPCPDSAPGRAAARASGAGEGVPEWLAPLEIAGRRICDPESFRQHVCAACRPVILRGLVRDWPAVRAAQTSPRRLGEYLGQLAAGGPVETFFGDPAIRGKYYYGARLEGFNFERRMLPLTDAVAAILAAADTPGAKSVYAGSIPAARYLPGFAADNPMPLLPAPVSPRVWLGTAANVSSHYDTFDNLACVIAGRRRFTLYAPELIGSLYMSPIDHTLSGPPVSLAASAPPEERAAYPEFEAVRDQALSAELEPGDALYLPKLWWHQVESTAPCNGLVNYWWDAFALGPDAPYTAMLLAMITIAERPPAERRAWQTFFDHYVFRTRGHPLAHLSPERHGVLGPLLPDNYGRLRASILRMLGMRGARPSDEPPLPP
jgi:Cupin-like domain